jgi:hypothetical protein
MRIGVLMVAALLLLLPASALATGTVRIQQSDNSVQTYTNVEMKINQKKETLTLTSADGISTTVISGAQCAPSGGLVRCEGGGFSLHQDGKVYVIPFKAAKFYFNLSDQDQSSPLLTMKVAPHSVVFALLTAKGTHITGNGKLDYEAPQ